MFQSCSKLKCIEIPSFMEDIGHCSFKNCYNLTSVLFGSTSKLKRVSTSAFRGCHKIRIIEYPHSVNFEVDSNDEDDEDDEDCL